MKVKEEDLSADLLKEMFTYHEDGYLTWNTRPLSHFNNQGNWNRFNTPNAGKVVGYFNKRTDSKQKGFGYWRVGISLSGYGFKGVGLFKLHRIIYALHHGYFPKVVDHIDGDTNNNKIGNLRSCTIKENSRNLKNSINNTTGYKGVCRVNRKTNNYRAGICYEGRRFQVGVFSTAEEAAAAYNLVASKLFKDFHQPNLTPFEEDNITKVSKFFKESYPKILEGDESWLSNYKVGKEHLERHPEINKGVDNDQKEEE